jgi:AraC-like DNA-binding protein
MGAAMPINEWLKLDQALSSEVSVRSASDVIEIALVQSGPLHREIVGGKIFVPKGHLLVIPVDREGTTTVMTSKHGVSLWLSEDLVDRICDVLEGDSSARSFDNGEEGASFLIKNRRIEALLQFLVDEVEDAHGAYTNAAETISESIVIELLDSTLHVGRSTELRDPRIRSTVRRMQASGAAELTVDDLANHVKMSRFEFSRLFRDDVGEAPYPFLRRLRLAWLKGNAPADREPRSA